MKQRSVQCKQLGPASAPMRPWKESRDSARPDLSRQTQRNSCKACHTGPAREYVPNERHGVSLPLEVGPHWELNRIGRRRWRGAHKSLEEDAHERRRGRDEVGDVLTLRVPLGECAWKGFTNHADGVLDPAVLELSGLRPLGPDSHRPEVGGLLGLLGR
eukprot:6865034-Pyramimonas_sp.AAC.1